MAHGRFFFAPAAKFRPVGGDRRVEIDQAPFDQLEQADGGERFGAGKNEKGRIRPYGFRRAQPGQTGRPIEHRLPAPQHDQLGAGMLAAGKLVDENAGDLPHPAPAHADPLRVNLL